MKTILTIFVLLLNTPLVFAQSKVDLEKINAANEILMKALKEKDSLNIAEAYFRFGKIENGKADYKGASEWFNKSLLILTKYGDSENLGRLYLRLSTIEYEQEHRPECLKYLKKAEAVYSNLKSKRGEMLVKATFGRIISKSWKGTDSQSVAPNYILALKYLNEAIIIANEIGDDQAVSDLNFLIGGILKETNSDKSTTILIQELKNQKGNMMPRILLLLTISDAFLGQNKIKEAFSNLNQAENIVKETQIKDLNVLSKLEESFSKYYELKGDFKNALMHIKAHNEYEIKRILQDREGVVSELNLKYDNKGNEVIIDAQRKDLSLKSSIVSLQRNGLLVGLFFLILISFLSYYLFKLYSKYKIVSNKNALLIHEQNHRIKNNLQVVSGFLTLQANASTDKNAKDVLAESQRRVDAVVLMQQYLYKNDEFEYINIDYIFEELKDCVLRSFGIENLEYSQSFAIKDMHADVAITLSLIFNEILTNSCKYAFNSIQTPRLKVQNYLMDDVFTFIINDNGSKDISKIFQDNENQTFGISLIKMLSFQINAEISYSFKEGSEYKINFKKI